MQHYAQTITQLLSQLQRDGYSLTELGLVGNAYKLAISLFTGLYRPSGKTFIAHLVGTASILSSLHAAPKVVAAGLVHAAYSHGDFGGWSKGISSARRREVRNVLGTEVEESIARYTALRWRRKTIPVIYKKFHTFGPVDQSVLLIRLANELEDLQELGVLYCFRAEGKRRHYMRFGPMMIDMSQKLGCARLAAELERVLGETAAAEIPVQLRCRHPGVALIAPRSYRRQALVAVYQELVRGFARLRSIIA